MTTLAQTDNLRIQTVIDIPVVLSHRVGEWLTQDEMNFKIGVYLHHSLIEYMPSMEVSNMDKVAQKMCLEALEKGIIEHDGGLLYRIKPT
jgi:hypothetical protein